MKNLVLTVVSVLALNTINAQQELIASVDVLGQNIMSESNNRIHKISSVETHYFNRVKPLNNSKIVRNLENEIANYDIKSNSIYDDSEKATYQVSFKRKSAKAYVTFNNDGEILNSKETYKNVNLPLILRIKILKEHPAYTVSSNKVSISYYKFLGASISYKVIISKGKDKKCLKVDQNYKSI